MISVLCLLLALLGGPDFTQEADEYLSKLPPTTADHLRKDVTKFDHERIFRLQVGLYREHLEWLSRGYDSRQLDLMIFIVVAKSVARTEEVKKEIRESKKSVERRLAAVELYYVSALAWLVQHSEEFKNLPSYMFNFFY